MPQHRTSGIINKLNKTWSLPEESVAIKILSFLCTQTGARLVELFAEFTTNVITAYKIHMPIVAFISKLIVIRIFINEDQMSEHNLKQIIEYKKMNKSVIYAFNTVVVCCLSIMLIVFQTTGN